MPRTRRAWSAIRTDIRTLLRETDSAASFWTNAELLLYFNACIDNRVQQLAVLDEGWVTDQWTADLVANQREYPVPEGAGRIKRVSLKFTLGASTIEIPLDRDEKWARAVVHTTGVPGSIEQYRPTYQLQGNLIILEPAPGFALNEALMIDLESAPARLSADGDMLDYRFPDVMETLLIYDTAVMALDVEHAQGNTPEGYINHIRSFRDKYENVFLEYCSDRTEGRVIGQRFRLGD